MSEPRIGGEDCTPKRQWQIEEAEVDAFVAEVDRALEEETYLALLPQFLVTGLVE